MGGRAVAVMGRYLGVVGVLADVLRGAGLDVVVAWAADDPAGPPRPTTASLADADGIVVVVTVAPGDPTLQDLRADGLADPVVAVTWHPSDELGEVPGPAVLLGPGEVLTGLADAVARLGQPSGQPSTDCSAAADAADSSDVGAPASSGSPSPT